MEGGNAAPNFKMTDKIFDNNETNQNKDWIEKIGCRNLLWGVEETKGQGLFFDVARNVECSIIFY